MLLLSLYACSAADPDKGPDGPGPLDSADTGSTPTEDSGAPAPPPYDCSPDHLALVEGVSTLDQGGSLPSLLVVHGAQACPIVVDGSDHSFVASAVHGNGRVLHAGHEGMITDADSQGGDNARLLLNAVRWAGGADTPAVGTEGRLGVSGWLRDQGLEVREVGLDELETVDVFLATSYTERTAEEIEALQAWVASGGGFLQGGHAWYWAYDNDNAAEAYPGNLILNTMGITVTEGTVDGGTDEVSPTALSDLLHAGKALDAVGAHLDGSAPLSNREQRKAADTVSTAVQYLPLSFDRYYDPVRGILEAAPAVTPTTDAPIVPDDQPIEALVVAIVSRFAEDLPPEEVPAVDSAFPGPVDPAAPRGTIVVDGLSATYAGRDDDYWYSGAGEPVWRGTGAYVPPGEVVTVTLPDGWAGQGLTLLVGAHTDTLWHLDSWSRHPELTRSYAVDTPTVSVASAFGGPLYVRVPGGLDLGEGTVTVEGAVTYPRYVHGRTDPAAFTADLASTGAPIVELESDRLVLTVPTSDLADALDPAALMDFWDGILDADADLAAIDRDRVRPERIAMDVQISAGWMHSGYPIMAYDYGWWLTDAAGLAEAGDWGAFHELGHNHQYGPLNLPGTTECTVNLWSVYDFEVVLGIDRSEAHSAITDSARLATVEAYLAGGADFDADWSVWTCLETWLQLQEAFGWGFYQDLHATYLAMPEAERPDSDQERVDRFVVESSREAGLDLTPFFEAWGFPISAATYAEVADLPPWEDHPLAGVR